MAHPCYIMRADDVCPFFGPVEQQSLNNVRTPKILRQTVIFSHGAIKRIEGIDNRVHYLFAPDVLCRLFQSLSPINIRVIEQCSSSRNASGHLIEVRDVIGKGGDARPSMPCKESCENHRPDSRFEQIRNNAAYPDKQQRKVRQNIAKTYLIGADCDYHDVKRNGGEQYRLTPRINKPSSRPDPCQYHEEERRQSRFECECGREVVPPSTRSE